MQYEAHKNFPVIFGVPHKIEQVLVNVIQNAIDAVKEKDVEKEIKISIVEKKIRKKPFLEVSIEDNGIGISQEDLAKIFEPFFTKKGDIGGIGLGLSVSYGIIKEIGGNITVNSIVGMGTTVNLLFPISK